MTKPAPAWLLLGPEAGEKKDFIASIKKSLTAIYGSAPDEYSFYPYDRDSSDIIALLRNISLFAPAKIVIIKNCHDLKKKDVSMIADYLKKPSDDAYLILQTEEMKADAAIEKNISPACKKTFWEMFDSKKKGWVIQFFHKENIAIDSSAVDFLIDMLEGDSETLKKECSNLAIYFDANEVITEERIADFFHNRKEENVFTMFDYIASGNFKKAVESSQSIILSPDGNLVRILGGLLWQFRNLYNFLKLLDKKKSFSDACLMMNIRGKKRQAVYSDASSIYSVSDIENIILLISYYDFLFRSTRIEIQHVMFPVFLYSVIIRKGINIDAKSSSAAHLRFP
ncbi:MAG: DNA polymerase III subunit delta [Spirochaetia bacterium]|jgi:DNA polymerase-3 subunit delta|nr:DNA polymerase III subunit delta [Spirochaetia bacterium]